MQMVVSGQLVNYEVLGQGKQNLLILHGWGGSFQEWMPVAEQLKNRYKIWLLDFPGFGSSPRPEGDWGVYEYANLVKEFLTKLEVKDPIVMGHSFGGRIAILLDAKKLILVDAAGLEIKSLKAIMSGLIFDRMGFMKKYVPTNLKNLFGSADYRSAGPMRKIFVKVVNKDLSEEIKKVTCPTLTIWGEKDLVLPLSQAIQIKSLISGSVLRIVWGADHWPHLSKKEEFINILEEEGI